MTTASPTAQEPIFETDGQGKPLPNAPISSQWYSFFQELLNGDYGTSFTPVANGLGNTGGVPSLTGAYYQNQGWTDFWIKITPVTNTTSTAGSTYFDLPFIVSQDNACLVGGTPGAVGLITTSRRCYPPGWTNNSSPITITGRVLSQ